MGNELWNLPQTSLRWGKCHHHQGLVGFRPLISILTPNSDTFLKLSLIYIMHVSKIITKCFSWVWYTLKRDNLHINRFRELLMWRLFEIFQTLHDDNIYWPLCPPWSSFRVTASLQRLSYYLFPRHTQIYFGLCLVVS